MNLIDLVRDWMEQRGPEYWNPDEDADVQYLRRQADAAHTEIKRLRSKAGRVPDLADALRAARREVGNPAARDGP
ncbi:MAG: hypothetical protein M3349_04250 [Actinomycetota bacterium]|nr:hypothetical protein [Actinomycetota bacterium]